MLRTHLCLQRQLQLHRGHILRQRFSHGHVGVPSRYVSSVADLNPPHAGSGSGSSTETYSLTYTYHPPSEIAAVSEQEAATAVGGAAVAKEQYQSTAQATSIEEVKQQKSAFDVYKSMIQPHSLSENLRDDRLKELFQRQIDLEQELNHKTAVESITNILKLTEMGKSANLKSVQRVLLEWYGPLVACLDEKVEAIGSMHKLETKIITRKGDKRMSKWISNLKEKQAKHTDLTKHGPVLSFLPTEKLAVITMNAVVNHILSSGNRANASVLCKELADIVETEVNLAKSTGQRLWVKSWQKEQVKDATGKPQIVKALGRQIRKYYDLDSWDAETKLKVGGALIEYFKSVATVNGEPALIHEAPFISKLKKKVGVLRLTDDAFRTITEDSFVVGRPKFLPMLVPPAPWRQGHQMKGGYLIARTPFLRFRSKSQVKVLEDASMDKLLEGLDFLGSIPWKMNNEVYEVAKELYARGEVIGEIPTKEVYPMPDESECFVPKKEFLKQERKMKEASIKKNKSKLSDAEVSRQLLELSNEVDDEDEEEDDDEMSEDSLTTGLYDDGEDEGDSDFNADSDSDSDDEEMIFDKSVMKYKTKKVQEKNQNNHSLRCDIEIKFSIAERFKEDQFYFPWNVDFRGRAYPVPPNLSHMGSDICRGMLTFAQPKALGPMGLDWLKCHLCNLFGYNKTDFQTRVKWSEEHMDEIVDSATKPLDGQRFWATSENPFQSLAACIEIHKAIQSGDPENYMCHLPVHQDGSCNGLQHYAALGRDKPGGQAVNLLPSEKPQDVYSEVLNLVLQAIDRDILISPDEPDLKLRKKGINARMIHGHVDRKVIKQTVMTSVYGVTMSGARAQIMGKLKDKLYGDQMVDRQQDDELFSAASYMAHLTIDSLGDMFSSANQIMDWLAKVALLVAAEGHVVSWTTPLGLPVMQPYVKRIPHTVKTLLQSITLSIENDALPVSAMKQKSAFPPNYVHSLDSTHMLMTGLKMKERGLSYTAVHDSYWTHACDVDTMNSDLRDCFIELYKKPLLEDLKNSLELRYPNIAIPPVPGRGELDIDQVTKSRYFFH